MPREICLARSQWIESLRWRREESDAFYIGSFSSHEHCSYCYCGEPNTGWTPSLNQVSQGREDGPLSVYRITIFEQEI